MSSIRFHSEHAETVLVRGSERALFGRYCQDTFVAALGSITTWDGTVPWIMRHIPASCYLHRGTPDYGRMDDVRTWLQLGGSESGLLLNGQLHSLFGLQLNTALVVGGNVLKLAARLHGQCELHCYVEGPHRAWLADLIAEGRRSWMLRPDSGWEEVMTLLRSRKAGPVVCSYSACESFPNATVVSCAPSRFDRYAKQRQWQLAMEGLRRQKDLELNPYTWDSFFFGEAPVSGFDFGNNQDVSPHAPTITAP